MSHGRNARRHGCTTDPLQLPAFGDTRSLVERDPEPSICCSAHDVPGAGFPWCGSTGGARWVRCHGRRSAGLDRQESRSANTFLATSVALRTSGSRSRQPACSNASTISSCVSPTFRERVDVHVQLRFASAERRQHPEGDQLAVGEGEVGFGGRCRQTPMRPVWWPSSGEMSVSESITLRPASPSISRQLIHAQLVSASAGSGRWWPSWSFAPCSRSFVS